MRPITLFSIRRLEMVTWIKYEKPWFYDVDQDRSLVRTPGRLKEAAEELRAMGRLGVSLRHPLHFAIDTVTETGIIRQRHRDRDPIDTLEGAAAFLEELADGLQQLVDSQAQVSGISLNIHSRLGT